MGVRTRRGAGWNVVIVRSSGNVVGPPEWGALICPITLIVAGPGPGGCGG